MPDLFITDSDFAEYVACSVYVHDYSRYFEKTDDKWLKLCLERDLVLQIKLEKTVHDAVKSTSEILKLGMRIVWPQANLDEPFSSNQHPNDRWFEARITGSTALMHYNIATGSLLVDSKPLSVLPEKYTQTELYKQVFEDKLLDVVASDDSKMDYMTIGTFEGHRLYFGCVGNPPKFQIHAKTNGSHFVAILRSKFGDDLPDRIVEKSNPWLCVNTSCMEFRSTEKPWSSSESDWQIRPTNTNELLYRMQSEKSFLLDNHVGVGSTICSALSSLEMSKYIHIFFDKEKKKLHIELPRYRLNFEVDQYGQLQCNELAAFVQQSQSLGTFYGLQNGIVMQDKASKSSNPKVWVLIPFGDVEIKACGSHVSAKIDIDEFDFLTFYKYRIDTTLKRLVPDQLEGHLWKAYLHACTSSSLSDELTGCTGIEEAFRTLDDRLLQTCIPFSVEAQQMVERIAHLSAYRSFYPGNNARHLQKTTWNGDLSFMMQHDGFHKKVREITYHNYKARFLYEDLLCARCDPSLSGQR